MIKVSDIKPYPTGPGYRKVDLVGTRRDTVTIIGYACHKDSRHKWIAQCDCGNLKKVDGSNFLKGNFAKCHCSPRRHGNFKHGHSGGFKPRSNRESRTKGNNGTKEYNVWRAMINRCTQPKDSKYYNYGARGITVCPKWRHNYLAFLDDVGRAPNPKFSLERINVYGNYEPGNVCWASSKMQANNRRNSRHLGDAKSNAVLSFGA